MEKIWIRDKHPGSTTLVNVIFLLLQVLKESKLLYVAEVTDLVYSWPSNIFPIEGVLCDPHLQVVTLVFTEQSHENTKQFKIIKLFSFLLFENFSWLDIGFTDLNL
jgi:hypothetical protein